MSISAGTSTGLPTPLAESIGRPVHISSVKLRLLPLPALNSQAFPSKKDPHFGSEPILHSAQCPWRICDSYRCGGGRLEVSRIHFDDASLNLVRDPMEPGTWARFWSRLRKSKRPHRPALCRPHSAFPLHRGRKCAHQFQTGKREKPLSFLNSDLSISLAPGDNWEVLFQAQPVRTDLDLDLADTGISAHRRHAPSRGLAGTNAVEPQGGMERSSAGQLSRLTLGSDIGWRGGFEVEAQVSGTAEVAQINAGPQGAGLHRSEFSPARPMDVATSCLALFRKESRSLEDISCTSPVGDGALQLTGSIQDGRTVPQANLHPGDPSRSRCSSAGRTAGSAQQPGLRGAGRRHPQRGFPLHLAKRA